MVGFITPCEGHTFPPHPPITSVTLWRGPRSDRAKKRWKANLHPIAPRENEWRNGEQGEEGRVQAVLSRFTILQSRQRNQETTRPNHTPRICQNPDGRRPKSEMPSFVNGISGQRRTVLTYWKNVRLHGASVFTLRVDSSLMFFIWHRCLIRAFHAVTFNWGIATRACNATFRFFPSALKGENFDRI
jgi:hypothetical protein